MNHANLYKNCFAFYLEAMETASLDKKDQIEPSSKEEITSIVYSVLDAISMNAPRFDKFVDRVAVLLSSFQEYEPREFHPEFYQLMKRLEGYDLKDAVTRLSNPNADDMKIMLIVARKLNEMVASNEIFMDEPVETDGVDIDDL